MTNIQENCITHWHNQVFKPGPTVLLAITLRKQFLMRMLYIEFSKKKNRGFTEAELKKVCEKRRQNIRCGFQLRLHDQ